MATPVISFQDYGFQYMAQAEPTLRHINLDIYPGEKVLIAGTSGRLEDVLWRRMDRIILMDEGAIVADLPTEKLLAGEQLLQHGIREPLYLTALRYAGVEITEALHPEHVEKLALTREDKEKVRSWYHTQKAGIRGEQHGQELLRITDLKFGYTPEKVTLQDVNFTIHKGEMVSIVGRNGAGKSTLAKLICGFEQPVSGSILMEGRDLKGDTIKEIGRASCRERV